MIYFAGDLSISDATILAKYSRNANSILEFGVGGSTQIMARNRPPYGEHIAVETSSEWIEKTRLNLNKLNISNNVIFKKYETVIQNDSICDENIKNKMFDLIFVDGVDNLREKFLTLSFDVLKVGGYVLIHDTRRLKDLTYVFKFCLEKMYEVETIFLNKEHSNITVIEKKLKEPYVNWNIVENKKADEINGNII